MGRASRGRRFARRCSRQPRYPACSSASRPARDSWRNRGSAEPALALSARRRIQAKDMAAPSQCLSRPGRLEHGCCVLFAGANGRTDMANSHGRFVWYELVTTDMEAAKAFYTEVVGWGAQDASTPGMAYTLFTTGGVSISGLMGLSEDARKSGLR